MMWQAAWAFRIINNGKQGARCCAVTPWCNPRPPRNAFKRFRLTTQEKRRIAKAKPGASIAAIAGDLVDCETMYAAKALLRALGSDLLEGRQTGLAYETGNLAAVNFNSTFAGIETADAIE